MRLRRGVVLLAGLLLLLTALLPGMVSAESDPYTYTTGPNRVYFPQTGHHLGLGFLSYWLDHGAVDIFGYPITEEIQQNGLTVQYFERAVFEYHPEAPPGQQVQLRLLGTLAKPELQQSAMMRQWRLAYLATANDVILPVDRPFNAIASIEENGDHRFFPETGHSINFAFKEFWERHGGTPIFGLPISEEYEDSSSGATIQAFERAVLEWPVGATTDVDVQMRRLGVEAAERDGVDTAPVAQEPNIPVYDPSLFSVTMPSDPSAVTTPPPDAPSGKPKWIEIDLTYQYLRAWEGDKVVFGQYVSTGLPDTPTPAGYFQVYIKLPFDDMTNGPIPPPGEELYDLKDVPNVMYFLAGGYAIHGAYWHADFGSTISHGCVNMTLSGAAWVYNWTPMGTPVWIHY